VRAKAEVDRIRGDFLAEMIDLEAHIDRAIVFFFAPDEWHLFIDVFIEKMGFAGKVDALRKVLCKVDAYDETNKGLCKEIDELRVERNKFAHMAFEFVGNSYMSEGGNYELYRKERLDPGARFEDVIHRSDLRRWCAGARGRAANVAPRALDHRGGRWRLVGQARRRGVGRRCRRHPGRRIARRR
jgi:hypothetical protein